MRTYRQSVGRPSAARLRVAISSAVFVVAVAMIPADRVVDAAPASRTVPASQTAPAAKAAPAIAAPPAVISASTDWLASVDSGHYRTAWERAADFLHQTIAEGAWLASVMRVRAGLGTLKSRRLDAAYVTRYLPGAPYGRYAVVHFTSAFAHRAPVSETITCMHQADGGWRVVGYYVQ